MTNQEINELELQARHRMFIAMGDFPHPTGYSLHTDDQPYQEPLINVDNKLWLKLITEYKATQTRQHPTILNDPPFID